MDHEEHTMSKFEGTVEDHAVTGHSAYEIRVDLKKICLGRICSALGKKLTEPRLEKLYSRYNAFLKHEPQFLVTGLEESVDFIVKLAAASLDNLFQCDLLGCMKVKQSLIEIEQKINMITHAYSSIILRSALTAPTAPIMIRTIPMSSVTAMNAVI